MQQTRLSASNKRVVPIAALLLVVLFKFQNCAPVTPMNSVVGGDIGDSTGGEVRIVDRWVAEKISFLSPTQIIEGDEVGIQGLCVGSEKGQQIAYQIIEIGEAPDVSPQVVNEGVVECVMGGFELQVQALNFASCLKRYQVRAARVEDNKNYAETVLQPNCAG